MIGALLRSMSRINQGYGRCIAKRARVETFTDLAFMWVLFGLFWAFAWNIHIIGPWVDNLMGWGPHDIDSARKVQWRRMWSTALCLPGIVAYGILYLRNRRK